MRTPLNEPSLPHHELSDRDAESDNTSDHNERGRSDVDTYRPASYNGDLVVATEPRGVPLEPLGATSNWGTQSVQNLGQDSTHRQPQNNITKTHEDLEMQSKYSTVTVEDDPPGQEVNNNTGEGSPQHVSNGVLKNNIQQDNIYTERDETDRSINRYNNLQSSNNVSPTELADPNVCVFCLDEGDLIHTCSCSVLAHKECALEYIRFPGGLNDCCCQCREKLKFTVLDKQTPMKQRYVFAFTILVILYLAITGLSFYSTTLMIPSESMDIWLYVFIVANLGLLWPLLIVFIFTLLIECCFGPRDRTSSVWSGCYCSGGCDCGSCDGDCGGDCGDDCGVLICILCLLGISLIILIGASAYLIFSLTKHYKSFALKSKKEIKFKHEDRPINTLAYNNA